MRKRKEESNFEIFCNNCSIRGVSKAYKSPWLLIKIVWICFIILMMGMLLYSIIKILREYLEYNTTIQTRLEVEDASLFPAITICPYQPFSKRALKFFEEGGMSPFNFSRKLRNASKYYLEKGDEYTSDALLFYDDLRIYYQNLDPKDAILIGLNITELLAYCITRVGAHVNIGKDDKSCGLSVTTFSNPEFFNCFTIKVKTIFSKKTKHIRLFLRFPNLEELEKYRRLAFLQSLSQNVVGAQLIIHESDRIPTDSREKIHIEPNRLLQINYQHNKWEEYSTPSDLCRSDDEEKKKIPDLSNQYNFTFSGCLDAFKAKMVMDQCGCVPAFLPRPIVPTETNPYCAKIANLDEEGYSEFGKRLYCVNRAIMSADKLTNIEKGCFRRCDMQKFDLKISTIKWNPSLWQLEWLYKIQQSWDTLIVKKEFLNNTNEKIAARKTVLKFLNAETTKDLVDLEESKIFDKHGVYACIVLERMANETFYKVERLGLSLFGLVSRVGGSCTLYVGLTCAFFTEIIEFLILICLRKKENKSVKMNTGLLSCDLDVLKVDDNENNDRCPNNAIKM